MLKLIGAILLIAGTGLWGISGARELKERAKALAAVTASVEMMEYELCDRLTPVPELFALLGKQAPKPADILFQNAAVGIESIGAVPFYELWHRAVRDTHELMLTEQEILILSELGFSLGKYDVSEQCKAVKAARSQFEIFTKKAQDECDKNWKSQAFLGVTAGLFAVIILL